ncbi:hypothetical protein C9439_00305 [archaeon SCG-AAA382B04]|nr:hypothetical protein C9439_00305 [archaeon SCG-AAA382B04]
MVFFLKKQKIAIIIILLITVSISLGCISGTTQQKTPDTQKRTEYYTITDDYDRKIKIPKEVDRVISTAPANTEILFALNAGNKVVGVTNYADYPPSALNKTKIGGFQNPNLEKIILQQPDVILANPQTGKKVGSMLESMGYPIVVINPSNLTEVMENIELIGRIVNKEQRANNLTHQMQSKIEEIKTKTHREEPKTSLFIISGFGGNYWVVGQKTFINKLK